MNWGKNIDKSNSRTPSKVTDLFKINITLVNMFKIENLNLGTVFGCTTLGSSRTFLSVSQSSNELACTHKVMQ